LEGINESPCLNKGELMTEEELHQWAKDNGYVKDGRDE